MSIALVHGGMYHVPFIDEFSTKTWIYFMKSKDEVFIEFQEFKIAVENQIRKKIKVLGLDNGGKYTSNEFKDFYKEVGIKRELTISYNPQQNGIAARKTKSIIRFVMAMIHYQDLPMFLCVDT